MGLPLQQLDPCRDLDGIAVGLPAQQLTLLANTGVWTRWWTSGTDLGREGHWYWASSLAPLPDFVWYPGQPARGHLENCAYFDQWQDFMIGDIDCGVNSNIYPICQIK